MIRKYFIKMMVIGMFLMPSRTHALPASLVNCLTIPAAVIMNGWSLRTIYRNGFNRWSLARLGATVVATYWLHGWIYGFTPEGRIEEAKKLFKTIDGTLLQYAEDVFQSQDNQLFFQNINNYYSHFALPLADVLVEYQRMHEICREARSLLYHALKEENEPASHIKAYANEIIPDINQLLICITHAIKLVKNHPDFLNQYNAYQQRLAADAAIRAAYAAQSNAAANWANAARR